MLESQVRKHCRDGQKQTSTHFHREASHKYTGSVQTSLGRTSCRQMAWRIPSESLEQRGKGR